MKSIRKIISSILAGSLVLSMGFMTGCKNGDYSAALNEIRFVSEDDPWYDTNVVCTDLEDYGIYISYCRNLYAGEDYFIADVDGSDWSSDEWYHVEIINKYSYDGEVIGSFDFSSINDSTQYAYPIKAYEYNGEIYYLVNVEIYGEEGEYLDSKQCTCTIDFDAKTIEFQQDLDFSDWYDGVPYPVDIAVSGNYVVYLLQKPMDLSYAFYVFDMSDGSHYVVNVPQDSDFLDFWFERSSKACEGKIYYYADRSEDSAIYSFDPDTGEYEVVRTLSRMENEDMYFLEDGTYLGQRENLIIKKDIVTGEEIEVVADLYSSSVSPYYSGWCNLYAYSGDTVVLRVDECSNSQGYQRIKLYLLTKADSNPHAGKQIVTVGYSNFFIDSVLGNLVEINNSDYESEYYIQMVGDYNLIGMSAICEADGITDEDYYVRINDQLINDIREGAGPDIMISGARFSAANPDLIYADLAPIMEADPNFSADDYSVAVTTGFEFDGGIYHVPYGMTLGGFAILDRKYSGRGFTVDEYVDFINCHMNGHDPLAAYDDYNPPLEDFEYFEELFSRCSDDFIVDGQLDITTGENGERFAQLVELVKNRDVLFHSEEGDSIDVRRLDVGSFYSYLGSTIFTSSSTPTNLVGFPSFDGRGLCSICNFTAAITVCCADKDAAWAIISKLLSYEVQSSAMDEFAPVRLDALEDSCDELIYLMEYGNAAMYFGWYDSSFDVEPFRDKFVDMVAGLDTFICIDPMIVRIMHEELPAYFEDQKTLEAVTEIIQTRVNNYLQEQE